MVGWISLGALGLATMRGGNSGARPCCLLVVRRLEMVENNFLAQRKRVNKPLYPWVERLGNGV
jgi:hypothetical protein